MHFLRSFLCERGYTAITIGNAEDAVKHYHAERPAAVILDLVMPGSMDGLAALAAFKKIDRDVPVIVLSGQGRTATVVQAMKLGASDFVSKPFDETDLEVPLTNALRQHQLTREVNSRAEPQSQSKTKCCSVTRADGRSAGSDRGVADTDVTVLIRVKAEPARSSSPGRSVLLRCVRTNRSSKSTARPRRPSCRNRSSSPERGAFTGAIQHKPGSSSSPITARCSSTKSAT